MWRFEDEKYSLKVDIFDNGWRKKDKEDQRGMTLLLATKHQHGESVFDKVGRVCRLRNDDGIYGSIVYYRVDIRTS